jgi:methyl-accepting chemotaxis protein
MKLKIKHRLWIVNAGLFIFLAFIYFLYSSLSGSFEQITQSSENTIISSKKMQTIISLTKAYINDKSSKQEVISALNKTDNNIALQFKTLEKSLNSIENIKKENQDIEKEILMLTNTSIQQSNQYINKTAERLADANLQSKVSVLERLVIIGANTNNNVNYQIAHLFKDCKAHPEKYPELNNLLDNAIKNATTDKEKLSNTPFAQLPIIALKSNQSIKILCEKYKSNQENLVSLSNDISTNIENAIQTISKNTSVQLKNNAEENRATIVMAVFILFGIIIMILIFNTQLSIIITRQLGGEPKEVSQIARSIANGNLNIEFDQSRPEKSTYKAMQDMTNSITSIINNIQHTIAQLNNSSNQLASTANEQAASAEEVSSSMEQMMANIEQNTENAIQTEKIATKANSEISLGHENVQQTVHSMNEIVDNISIIEELAEKTDLLAINAAIEAARAGEHGKGFAVVAVEIRKLAERSQNAAAQINEISKSSVGIAEKTGKSMSEVVPEIEKTLRLVQEISAASTEQNSGVNQVNNALQQLNVSNQSTASNADTLQQHAQKLEEIISFFQMQQPGSNWMNKNTVPKAKTVPSKAKVKEHSF